jgi:hypothetical protein
MRGRRAALKVGLKNAVRNRHRTIFLLLLVAVPVAVGTFVAGIARATNLTPEQRAQVELGAADARIYADPPGVLAWVTSTMEQIDPGIEFVEYRSAGLLFDDGTYFRVRDLDLSNPVTAEMLVVLDGQAPVKAGEVALSPAVATKLEVDIGDMVDLSDFGFGRLRVTGLVSEPLANGGSTLLLSPGALGRSEVDSGVNVLMRGDDADQDAQRLSELWYSEGQEQFWPEPAVDPKPDALADVPDEIYVFLTADEVDELLELAASVSSENSFTVLQERAWSMVYESGRAPGEQASLYVQTRSEVLSQGSAAENSSFLSAGAAAVLLIEVAFVTGAAFAAGTRRRLREIGLLGVNGASEKQVRVTVLGEGLGIALAGSLAGALFGVVLFVVGRPLIQPHVSKVITGVGIGVTDLLGPVLVAMVSVALAVWIPSRTAGRIPVTAALQGRMPATAPRKWTVPVGLASAVFGAALVTVATGSIAADIANAFVGLGSVLIVGGVALLASPILAGLTQLADRVPATGRLVVRDSGRHRTRASVAVAAIMVTLLGPMIGITVAAMTTQQNLVYGLPEPEDQIVLSGSYAAELGDLKSITPEDLRSVAAIVPVRSAALFDTIGVSVRTKEMVEIETGELHRATLSCGDLPNRVAVASYDLLETIGDDRVASSIDGGDIVVLGVEDKPTVVYLRGDELPAIEYAVPVLKGDMPRILVPEAVARQYDDAGRRTMALVRLQRPLTQDELTELSSRRFSLTRHLGSLTAGAAYAIIAGVALIVVLIVIALVTAVSAAEVDEELRTIVAVGAPGSFRRRFLGLLTGYQTLIAALLALPLGLGLIKVFTAAHQAYYQGPFGEVSGSDIVFSWPELASIVLGMPALVGILTALSVRSAPVTPPRRVT